MSQLGIYEYHNNILSVAAWIIYEDLKLWSYVTYKRNAAKMKIERTKEGKGKGNTAFVSWRSLSDDFKAAITAKYGDPEKQAAIVPFKDYLKIDLKAVEFFRSYLLEDGNYLPRDKQKEYCTNAMLLNGCGYIDGSVLLKNKTIGASTKVWASFAEIIKELDRVEYPHSLPAHPKDLKYKYLAFLQHKTSKKYNKSGYEGLIHGNYQNKNSQKLSATAKDFLIAAWGNQVRKIVSMPHLLEFYNETAKEMGWKPLESEKTLSNFLYNPKIENLWYGHRHGELKAKEKYNYQHKTELPSMRDGLWYGDGTKLNYHYLDEDGKMATCQVYEVIDAYSEVFLGYHISATEDSEAQYLAYRMAIETSGAKPYQIGFDGQGGQTKKGVGRFLDSITNLAIKTTPYNGKSKTIESIFGRFQKMLLKKDWFFTGMNITTKSLESKSNREFILDNAKNLPTLKEIKEVYKKRRQEWNEAKHYATGKRRIDMYLDSVNPETVPVNIWDMVELFWIERKLPITCTASGIAFTHKKIKYEYMVHDADRMPDLAWLRNNVDNKFVIKFDPKDMTIIHLYEQTSLGLRFTTQAETKITTHRGKQEQEEWEAEFYTTIQAENDAARIATRDRMEEVLECHGMSAEQQGLNKSRIKGIETSRKKKKPVEKIAKRVKHPSYGESEKEMSNMLETEDVQYKY